MAWCTSGLVITAMDMIHTDTCLSHCLRQEHLQNYSNVQNCTLKVGISKHLNGKVNNVKGQSTAMFQNCN